MNLKENYILANCCRPTESDPIVGYHSYDGMIKVHRADCRNLAKAEQDRLVKLEWAEITAGEDFTPDADYNELDAVDFQILEHHRNYGVDYSLKVAGMLHMDAQMVFDSHKKMRSLGLLTRVKPLIIQYRKNIVDNKWIKHRNHTYYELTDKGENYLAYFKKET